MEDPKQSLRTNVAMMLILAVTMGSLMWNSWRQPVAGTGPDAGVVGVNPAAVTNAVAPSAALPNAPSEAPAPTDLPQRDVNVQRPEIQYHFSSDGAGVVRAELQGRKMREQAKMTLVEGYRRLLGGEVAEPPQMDMAVPVEGSPLPLSVSVLDSEKRELIPANERYRVEEGSNQVTFTTRKGQVELVKRFSWPAPGTLGEFEIRMDVSIKNVSDQPLKGEYGVAYARAVDPRYEEAPSFFGGVGNQSRATCQTGEGLEKVLPKGETAEPKDVSGKVSFVGIDQQYFLSAIYPLNGPKAGRCRLYASPSARVAQAFFPLDLGPGQTSQESFGAFLGPKDVELLSSVPTAAINGGTGNGSATAVHPPLEDTVNFGIWAVICKVLLTVLKAFYRMVHSWGLAIVLLTVAVKVLLLPLTHKSMVSAEEMKKLQPKMEEMRKKYADDRERQSMETMKIYQQAKVNPLGGCLPLLLQMPIWIALFTTLRNSYEIYQEPFLAPFITDLTFKDPTYLLPLLLGITMVVTQQLQPQPMMDPAQAKIMTWVMPIFFTAIMLNYPAGLTLYIFTNNVLSIVQQWGLRKYLQARGVTAHAVAK